MYNYFCHKYNYLCYLTGERRIKTFVRTKSGRKVAKYQYVAEDVYEEMVALNKAGARASDSAKRRLKQKLAESMGLSVSFKFFVTRL